jgi:hypothetical protein
MSEKVKEFLEAISFANSKLNEWADEIEESEIDEEPDEQGSYKVDYIIDLIESVEEIYNRVFDLSKKWSRKDKENE